MTGRPTVLPTCSYCQRPAVFMDNSGPLYNGRNFGPVWFCRPCDAWVGCHPDGKPLGRLANAELRRAKIAAHAAFDPLWKAKMVAANVPKRYARGLAYAWLAEQLNLPVQEAHIGSFDVILCQRVVEVCRPYTARIYERQYGKRGGQRPYLPRTPTPPAQGELFDGPRR